MAVAQQLTVHVQGQVQNGVIHSHGANRHLEGRRGCAVSKEGVANRLGLLERSQQPFASRQRFPVDARHKAPVGLGGVHFAGQVIAKEGIHQPGPRRKHAREIVRSDLGAGAADQRVATGNRLTAEPAHLNVNALTHVFQIAALGVAAGTHRHVAEHGLQPARQTTGAGLQAADRLPARRRHAAVGGILHGGQVAIQLIHLLEKTVKHDGLPALLQRLSQLNHRRVMVGHQLLRRLGNRGGLRWRVVIIAEQRFQCAGGAAALRLRFTRIFRRWRIAGERQDLAQVLHQAAQRRVGTGKQARGVDALGKVGAVIQLNVSEKAIPVSDKVAHIELAHGVIDLLFIFLRRGGPQHPGIVLVQGGGNAVNLAVKAFPVAVRRIQTRNAFAHRLAAFAGKYQLALRSAQVGKGDRLQVVVMLQQALQAAVDAG